MPLLLLRLQTARAKTTTAVMAMNATASLLRIRTRAGPALRVGAQTAGRSAMRSRFDCLEHIFTSLDRSYEYLLVVVDSILGYPGYSQHNTPNKW